MCGEVYETGHPVDILRLCGAIVQLTRLLRKMRQLAPSADTLVDMARPIERHKHTIIHVYKTFVRKEIHKFVKGYADVFGVQLCDLQAAYGAGVNCLFLPQLYGVAPSIVDAGRRKWKQGDGQSDTDGKDMYSVELNHASVGIAVDYKKLGKEEVQQAVLCVLRALKALHALHLAHRDVRWGNVLRCVHRIAAQLLQYFKLIDLEMVAKEDQVPSVEMTATSMTAWDDGTLKAGVYAASSDIYSVGSMLRQWSQLTTSAEQWQQDGEGQAFLTLLLQHGTSLDNLLGHAWLAQARIILPDTLRPHPADVEDTRKRAAAPHPRSLKKRRARTSAYGCWADANEKPPHSRSEFNALSAEDKAEWVRKSKASYDGAGGVEEEEDEEDD